MESFREAYGVLQRHAQTLRNQDEPNIDDLLTIVTESVNAYKVCKQVSVQPRHLELSHMSREYRGHDEEGGCSLRGDDRVVCALAQRC
ncbi:exodeoxyribonuclease VII small subunit, partial [Acidovorax sp. SD340]|uniref:exodeoxyribonuclease VII small subunit n=1 Tax=Acidovorax sp. SD340 TaxID=1690268 RepID=UPI000A4574BA